METKIVKGDIFIIPNPAGTVKDFLPESAKSMKEKWSRLIGIKLKDEDEKLIEVWVASETCDDWACTYGGFQKHIGVELCDPKDEDSFLVGYFPKFLPISVLKGKKEDDVLKFHCPEYNVDIELTCNQLGRKYRWAGEFEKALRLVAKGDL
jgi:hypothetical protein